MKHVIFLGDGMADLPVEELNGKTPLEAAAHPNMDRIARHGRFGMTRTVPEGMPPGSDTANLSVFGYDPKIYYSGRSPLEAANLGIVLQPEDVSFRCNFVTLTPADSIEAASMKDYSAGELPTELARQLIDDLASQFAKKGAELYCGTKYRHCLVLRNAPAGTDCQPPHDMPGLPAAGRLPTGANAPLLLELMHDSFALLKDHPVNRQLIAQGKNPVTCCWFWGEGRRPALDPFSKLYGIRGGVISAVDLLRGIARCAGMQVLPVDGVITGDYHTDFSAKARAAIRGLKEDCDLVYIHVEAPDECGHHHEVKEKVWAIEQIDRQVIGPVLEYLEHCGEAYSVLVMPDHPTPLSIQAHSGAPVPFALWDSRSTGDRGAVRYTEAEAAASGEFEPAACALMGQLTAKN